jgi:hypothetical protein
MNRKPGVNNNYMSIGVSVRTTKFAARNNSRGVRHPPAGGRNPQLQLVPNVMRQVKSVYDERINDNYIHNFDNTFLL